MYISGLRREITFFRPRALFTLAFGGCKNGERDATPALPFNSFDGN
jgi:hypothetical protein